MRSAGGDLPADDHPGEDVEDERDVGPPGVGADIGQVGHPQLVRRGRRRTSASPGPAGRSVSAPSPMVVLRVFSRGIPRRPSARISRSTVQRATLMPSRLSSAWIFRAP